jgi:uncharacterized protein (DUF58 family)
VKLLNWAAGRRALVAIDRRRSDARGSERLLPRGTRVAFDRTAMNAPTSHPASLLRKLEWRVRHTADSLLGGEYRSAFRGRGREFDQVVQYEFGDDVRDIDWNVTARRGEPYRKKYVEERELTIVLLFDDSLSLQFGSGLRSKRATLLELAGLLALLSAGNRDRAGFWHATPDKDLVREPVRGRTAIVETAARLFAQPIPDLDRGGEVDIDWQRFFRAFPRHSVVVWLGDFAPRPLPPAWPALRRRYQLIGMRVEDPWERVLPARGRMAAVDPTTGELVPFDPSSRASRARHALWLRARDAYFKQLFPSPLDCLTVSSEDDLLGALLRFFRARLQGVKG